MFGLCIPFALLGRVEICSLVQCDHLLQQNIVKSQGCALTTTGAREILPVCSIFQLGSLDSKSNAIPFKLAGHVRLFNLILEQFFTFLFTVSSLMQNKIYSLILKPKLIEIIFSLSRIEACLQKSVEAKVV